MAKFTYIYDTYCGWCYGASPVVHALIDSGADITVMHRHLFQGAHAARMADGFGKMAEQYDKRIASLSGQEFSQAYVNNILRSPTEVLDSGLTALAAALIHEHGAKAEMALAAQLQKARYVDGQSAADRDVITKALALAGITAPLESAKARADQMQAQAEALQAQYGISGVPGLLRHDKDGTSQINISEFYKAPERVVSLAA